MAKYRLLFATLFLFTFATTHSADGKRKKEDARNEISVDLSQELFKLNVNQGRYDAAAQLLDQVNVDYGYADSSNPRTLLEQAVEAGLELHRAGEDTGKILERMQFLIESKADVNREGHNGATLLLKMVRFGFGECWKDGIDSLLNAQARPEQKDLTGESALSCALKKQRYDAAALLIRKTPLKDITDIDATSIEDEDTKRSVVAAQESFGNMEIEI